MTPAARLDETSQYYDQYWSRDGYNPEQLLYGMYREILERTVSATDTSLDVGCGAGAGASAWLAGHTASYMGVDVSDAALDAARAKGHTVQRIDDAATLPFADATFSLVMCNEVMEHLLEPQLAAAEMLRVLAPGGTLVCTVPNVAYWRRRADLLVFGRWNPMGDAESTTRPWRDPHLRFFALRNLTDMLTGEGFTVKEAGAHGMSPLQDIPLARKAMRSLDPGPAYRRLMSAMPSLFGARLHAIATKPVP